MVIFSISYYARTGDIEGTLSRMPDHRTREIMVLKALKRCGKTEVFTLFYKL